LSTRVSEGPAVGPLGLRDGCAGRTKATAGEEENPAERDSTVERAERRRTVRRRAALLCHDHQNGETIMTTTTYTFATLIAGIVAGINKRLGGQTLKLLNRDWTDKDLVALFQAVPDTAAAEKDADAKRNAAIAAARSAREEALPVFKALKPVLLAMYAGNPEALADFELHERKVGTKTPAVKAAAVTKAKATRKALGTKGPKQRKAAKKVLDEQAAAGASAAPPSPPASPAPPTAPKA
jgi:hypothetical protein